MNFRGIWLILDCESKDQENQECLIIKHGLQYITECIINFNIVMINACDLLNRRQQIILYFLTLLCPATLKISSYKKYSSIAKK